MRMRMMVIKRRRRRNRKKNCSATCKTFAASRALLQQGCLS